MTELKMIAYMGLGGILFALGGTTSVEWKRIGLPICTLCPLSPIG